MMSVTLIALLTRDMIERGNVEPQVERRKSVQFFRIIKNKLPICII